MLEVVLSRKKENLKLQQSEIGSAASQTSQYPYFRINDAINSMSTGLLQQMMHVATFVKGLYYIPYMYVWEHYALIRLPDNTVSSWLLCFFFVEIGYYWYHRKAHEMNCFWAAHITHHSSQEYNLTTALRQGAIQYAFAWIYYLPCALFIPPVLFSFHSHFNRIYQFWIHTQLVGRFHPLIEYIFNTPSHHRVHHGRNPRYIDKNYGGTLIIFDRMFGTFEPETEEVVYGIVHNINSWNPLYANTHHWSYMYALSKRLQGINKLKVLWRGPGFNPKTNGDFTAPLAKTGERRYDRFPVDRKLIVYITVHFLLSIAFLKTFNFPQIMNGVVHDMMVLLVVWTLLTVGGLMDGRSWAVAWERKRLVFVGVYASLCCYYEVLNKLQTAGCVLAASVCMFWLYTCHAACVDDYNRLPAQSPQVVQPSSVDKNEQRETKKMA
eukprot:GILJ01002640.1.p1 GENE.GILJ01002640.1~~GILJ01002640.1.p1  ORF type:complete len:514 (-),score=61.74 GILJ01002640.1:254-1564(-)